ncbi:hypothetical protein BZL30_9459 [Mycobacterium kansasii]|uniref:Uncharacterized protein n=1 Tax=Mycobacterium kansasii TaxID=1768 RepID=A0A1V3W947_MYCKA|nr:hypothetical protein BZL30_9459 [Mycobacterium kansasii]
MSLDIRDNSFLFSRRTRPACRAFDYAPTGVGADFVKSPPQAAAGARCRLLTSYRS